MIRRILKKLILGRSPDLDDLDLVIDARRRYMEETNRNERQHIDELKSINNDFGKAMNKTWRDYLNLVDSDGTLRRKYEHKR